MIIVTGAAGFIGSAILWKLNQIGRNDIICVDQLRNKDKWKNIRKRNFNDFLENDKVFDWIDKYPDNVDIIIHMGACSSTTEQDADYLMENNYRFSQKLFTFCASNKKRFIYASSAATYGNGEQGFDDEQDISSLVPLNKYGYSKQIFDKWQLKQTCRPQQCVGLKFFNVYGPNEYHKGNMASVIYHAYNQINESSKLKLFKSYKEGYSNGEQLRDFIYVKDICNVIEFLIDNCQINGLFNLGTGRARSFNDLAKALFNALSLETNIEYIEMPYEIRDKYQYFTEANINKLRKSEYNKDFYTLEDGIKDYTLNYLIKEDSYL